MLKLALCDDQRPDLDLLLSLLADYRRAHPTPAMEVFPYTSPSGVLDADIRFDLFLLDILMPGINGIELGLELRRRYPVAPILYLTTSRDFALASYRAEAMGYLVKPVERGELFHCLDRAAAYCARQAADVILVPAEDGVCQVFLHTLLYAEAAGHGLSLHLLDGVVLTAGRTLTFAKLWEQLKEDGRFLPVRRGCLVNMELIRRMGGSELVMTDGARIPIARSRRASTHGAYLAYCDRCSAEVF